MKTLLSDNEYLPLEPFCSSEYDYVSTEDWLAKLKATKSIPAHRFNQERMQFEEVVLIDEESKKDAENERMMKRPTGKKEKAEVGFWFKNESDFELLHRWQVLFPEESVAQWVKKVTQAIELRKLMDNLLRFNYYVDNMPIDDINGLETMIQTGVMDKVAYPFDKAQIDPLMEEMNQAFTRLQNEVLFRKHLSSNGDSNKMLSKELKLQFKKKGVAPYHGRLQLKRQKEVVALNLGRVIRNEAKTFNERLKAFGMASLYTVKEVIAAMDAIKQECL